MLSSILCSLISWLRLKQHAAHVYRQGLSCAGKAYHAKICACVAMCNTMWVCKCTELCLWSRDIFRLWSAEWLGWAAACSAWIKMQCVDHCWVPVWWPVSISRTHYRRDVGGEWLGGYIYTLVTPVQPSKHRDIPKLFLWLDVDSTNKTAPELRGFLFGTLLSCVVLWPCKALR